MTVQILVGDVRQTLSTLPEKSVQCCVTSPPYFGLRDYGVDGQIGLEPTPAEYVEQMVQVFREVRRVLRDDGTLWLNLGDSYATRWSSARSEGRGGLADNERERHGPAPDGYKNKDLMGIPWRVAFALQADGWYLRQDIIWHKPNPMPESVRDRCTKAHEYVFLLSKSERYYWDAEAIAEPSAYPGDNRAERPDTRKAVDPMCMDGGSRARTGKPTGDTRNKRSVWTVTTRPYKGAHFATFPPDLIRPCVLAGAPFGGVVLDPFLGSGTTAAVAVSEGRHAIGCELNPEYVALAQQRIAAAEAEVLW